MAGICGSRRKSMQCADHTCMMEVRGGGVVDQWYFGQSSARRPQEVPTCDCAMEETAGEKGERKSMLGKENKAYLD